MKQYYLVIAGLRNANFTSEPVLNESEARESAYGVNDSTFKSIPIGIVRPKIDALSYIVKNGKNLLKNSK